MPLARAGASGLQCPGLIQETVRNVCTALHAFTDCQAPGRTLSSFLYNLSAFVCVTLLSAFGITCLSIEIFSVCHIVKIKRCLYLPEFLLTKSTYLFQGSFSMHISTPPHTQAQQHTPPRPHPETQGAVLPPKVSKAGPQGPSWARLQRGVTAVPSPILSFSGASGSRSSPLCWLWLWPGAHLCSVELSVSDATDIPQGLGKDGTGALALCGNAQPVPTQTLAA